MLSLLSLSCGLAVRAAEPPPADLKPDMMTHYDQVSRARDALVRGDLRAFRNQVADLAERLPLTGLPGEARPFEPTLVSALLRAQAADSIPEAAERLGEIAAACGACHKQMRVAFPISESAEPPQAEVMRRHAWAVDQLWQGLVGDSDEAMERGYMLLSETQLYAPGSEHSDPMVLELQLRVHDEAASMLREGQDRDARSASYGRMLGTCSQCHALTGGGPGEGQKDL